MILVTITCYTEERVDLTVFIPACLPSIGETFVNHDGLVYGEQTNVEKVLFTLVLFRLGSHWSYRHLDRQAAGDLGPDSAEQHLLGEDEPDRGCGQGPDHLRRGGRGRALQGLGEVFLSSEVYFS